LGVILAILTYTIMRIARTSLTRAIAVSITLLWVTFWAFMIILTGGVANISVEDIIVICVDGSAALITAIILSKL
jgi:hypothetical protein